MWKPIEEVLPVVLVVLFISQIALPLAFTTKVFWLFRKTQPKQKTTLEQKITETKEKSDEVKIAVTEIKSEFDTNLNKLLDTKKEVDNL